MPRSLKIFGLFEATNAGYFDAENFYGDNLQEDEPTVDGSSDSSTNDYKSPEIIVGNLIKRWSLSRGCPGVVLEELDPENGDDGGWLKVMESKLQHAGRLGTLSIPGPKERNLVRKVSNGTLKLKG